MLSVDTARIRHHPLFDELERFFPGRVAKDVPLESRTTFRCRTSAAAVLSPGSAAELARMAAVLRANRTAIKPIGRGSNLLVRDGGYPGVLIHIGEGLSSIEERSTHGDTVLVRAEAGVSLSVMLSWLRRRGFVGFGFAHGIPGSVGGAVRMNAGTARGWISQKIERVEAIDSVGRTIDTAVAEADFSYRGFPKGREWLITAGVFRFLRGSEEDVACEIEEAARKRRDQPLDLPNTGSVFKNPPGDFAGRLIEAAGLKGRRIGDAEISLVHANFIVNRGAARVADVEALMDEARTKVREMSGVDLEAEVEIIGVVA